MLLRYTSAVLLGTVATFGLLTLMRSVIADPLPVEDDGITGEDLVFVRVVEERELEFKTPRPEPPTPPEKPPERSPQPDPGGEGVEILPLGPLEPTPPDGELLGTYMDDGNYLPIVRVSPIYPRRALTRGIEGYVLVEFVVTETGAVRDPVVLYADPPGFFERAAVTAVLKFKYRPKVAGGKPVAVSGVRSRIVFEMED